MLKSNKTQLAAILLMCLLVLAFVPWLGLTPFNTKGEPREAIVAVSMLQSGNWILPVSFGADIPYKPPFMAWCIAVFSTPFGHVTEFTSRLPSAIAAVCMAMTLFCFVRRRLGGLSAGVLSALIFVTSVEVWRAASACRVDMLFSAFVFGALAALFRWRDAGWRGMMPVVAVLCMTCAVLTKGPAGIILPCLVTGVFGLLRGDGFWRLFVRLFLVGVASLIIPAFWYAAAYRQGGDEFLSLVVEENFGRFAGTMSYSSHEKGLWYNFATVAIGMSPYTLLGVLSLAVVRWRHAGGIRSRAGNILRWLRSADAAQVFCLTAVAVIFIFYCIPRSKRSVYLLPIYPFLAYYTLLLVRHIVCVRPSLARAYCAVVAAAAIIVSGVAIASPVLPECDYLPLHSLSATTWSVAFLAFVGAVYLSWALWMRRTAWCMRTAIGVTVLTLTALSAALLPDVLAVKSDRFVARDIERLVPEGTVYSFIDTDMLRYYTVNFYMADRLRLYERELPLEGYMLIGEADIESWQRHYGGIYSLTEVASWTHRSCDSRQPLRLVHFDVRP